MLAHRLRRRPYEDLHNIKYIKESETYNRMPDTSINYRFTMDNSVLN